MPALREDDNNWYRLRNEAVSWAETDDGIAVLDLKRSVFLAVNVSGAALWRQLSQGATPRDLELLLQTEFGVPEDRAQTDVRAFLADAVRLELCEVGSVPGGRDADAV